MGRDNRKHTMSTVVSTEVYQAATTRAKHKQLSYNQYLKYLVLKDLGRTDLDSMSPAELGAYLRGK